jgi:hypothetical protein
MLEMRRLSVGVLASAILATTIVSGGTARAESVNIRPITDWTSVRPTPGTGNWTSPVQQLPDGYFAVFYRFAGAPAEGVDLSKLQVDGKVIERRLVTGEVEVTVRLDVRNAPITVYLNQKAIDFLGGTGPFPTAVFGAAADGSIDYTYELRVMTADFNLPLVPPNFISAPRASIVGTGTGHFTSYAAQLGFTPGATGEIHITQIGLFAVSQHANGVGVEDAFPGELVNLRETGR